MTIDEAIEIKSRTGEEFLHTNPDLIDKAERLSIEALKRCRDYKKAHTFLHYSPMPGETEEAK